MPEFCILNEFVFITNNQPLNRWKPSVWRKSNVENRSALQTIKRWKFLTHHCNVSLKKKKKKKDNKQTGAYTMKMRDYHYVKLHSTFIDKNQNSSEINWWIGMLGGSTVSGLTRQTWLRWGVTSVQTHSMYLKLPEQEKGRLKCLIVLKNPKQKWPDGHVDVHHMKRQSLYNRFLQLPLHLTDILLFSVIRPGATPWSRERSRRFVVPVPGEGPLPPPVSGERPASTAAEASPTWGLVFLVFNKLDMTKGRQTVGRVGRIGWIGLARCCKVIRWQADGGWLWLFSCFNWLAEGCCW